MNFHIYNTYGMERISTRKIGDSFTNEDLWDSFIHIPGCRMMIRQIASAVFHNGFSFEIPKDKLRQLRQASKYKDIFGFAAVVIDGDNIQAWLPKTDGIGFEMTDFDDLGECTKILITVQPRIGRNPGKQIPVERADPENGFYDGFYLIRTDDGVPGERGLSQLIHLIDIFRTQNEVFLTYLDYADNQGVALAKYKIKNYDRHKDSKIDEDIQKINSKNDAIVMDIEEDLQFESPQANAYDPSPILDKADEFIARESCLNKLQLTGDPEGHLSSSQTALAKWYANVKEEQDIILPQIIPILMALGAPEDVIFNDPTETNLAQQMESLSLIRQAMEGLVSNEDIVKQYNEQLGLEGDNKLKAIPEEKLMPENKPMSQEDINKKAVDKYVENQKK